MHTTRLSSKGQIIIPKAVRDAHGWREGMEFIVEDGPHGMIIKPRPVFAPTALDDVFGCLKDAYAGPAKTLEEMEQGVLDEAAARWKRKSPI